MMADDFRAVRAALSAQPGASTPTIARLANLGTAEASGILVALRTGRVVRSSLGAGFYLRWWPDEAHVALRAVA